MRTMNSAWQTNSRHTRADLLAFLRQLNRVFLDQELRVVLDNVSTHTTPAVHAWLERNRRLTFHCCTSWRELTQGVPEAPQGAGDGTGGLRNAFAQCGTNPLTPPVSPVYSRRVPETLVHACSMQRTRLWAGGRGWPVRVRRLPSGSFW